MKYLKLTPTLINRRYVGLFLIVVVVFFSLWFVRGLAGMSGSPKSFTIEPGEKRTSVAQRLESAGIIRSKAHFLLLSYLKGQTIIAGTFTLVPSSSVGTIITTLSTKSKSEQSITIPEGWRREQIAEYLKDKGVNPSEFLTATKDLEGKLFPDTYYIAIEPKVADVVKKMTDNYEARTKSLKPSTAQLILASIVEREAKKDTDRPLIAGIYQGRINDGMRLEADPTVQYGRDTNLLDAGTTPDPFWGPITLADYQRVISPYNTYRIASLPPGPIANPGIKSIEAAVNPTKTSARYFFHTGDGQTITSRTLDEHNRNKDKYLR